MGEHDGDGGQSGAGAFEIMLGLMSRTSHWKIMHQSQTTYAEGKGWRVWLENQATAASRAIVESQGLKHEEYALHSGRIGDAARLAAMGLSAYDIQQQRRWMSDAVGMYIRASRESEEKASYAIASHAKGKGVQPGQVWTSVGVKGKER